MQERGQQPLLDHRLQMMTEWGSSVFSFTMAPMKSPALPGRLCLHFLGVMLSYGPHPMLPHKCVVRINEIMSTVFSISGEKYYRHFKYYINV